MKSSRATGVVENSSAPWVSTIESAIRDSMWMLKLGQDWDDEGSPPIEEATWKVATDFLRRQADAHWRRHSKMIPVPHITPGSDGSIDIHWRTEQFELLVNIQRGPEFSAGFYGDNYGRLKIKGVLDPSSESAYLPLDYVWSTSTLAVGRDT